MQPAVKITRIQIKPTDEMLVEHSLNGDLEAFEQIFYRYCQPVYEYACLVCGVRELSEKVLIKSFLKFFRELKHFRFKHKVLHVLLQISTDIILRSHQKGEMTGPDEAAGEIREFEGLDLIDRSVLVMGQRFGFNIGMISWILRLSGSRIFDRLNDIESRVNQPVHWPEIEWPALDYRVMLLSRVRRIQTEKKSYFLLVPACVILIFLVGFWWKISRHLSARPNLIESRVSDVLKIPNSAPESRELFLLNIQDDREVFFERGKGFAEESLVMAPGRGKVLAVDYELFERGTKAGLKISFLPVDLHKYPTFKFYLKGDAQSGFPQRCSVVFKNTGTGISRSFSIPVSAEWKEVAVSFKLRGDAMADEAYFVFDDQSCGKQRSGKIYIDRLAFARL